MSTKRIGLAAALAIAAGGLAASSAHASIVTVGSPFTALFTSNFNGPATEANSALAEPGTNVTSPVTGTIVRWRIIGNSGPFELRVLRPAGGGSYTGAGSSGVVTTSGTGANTIDANLPIRAGDLLGLDLAISAQVGEAQPVSGSAVSQWMPPLADGSTFAPSTTFAGDELAFNADVQPTNTFSIAGITRNKRKGTATLNLTLPNPGDLTASGNGVTVASAGRAVVSKSVGAGATQLLVKATGKKKRTLNATGKAKLNLTIKYTPTFGDPSTQSLQVKLKKKL